MASEVLTRDGKVRKPSKYLNRVVRVGGQVFHSQGEANYYLYLLSEQQQGRIASFMRQVPIPLIVGEVLICQWVPDFVVTMPDGRMVVHEYKGRGGKTEAWRIKIKLARATWFLTHPDVGLHIEEPPDFKRGKRKR